MLYHYTSFCTLIKILSNIEKRNGIFYLKLRASRIDTVNDPIELKITPKLFRKIIERNSYDQLNHRLINLRDNEIENIFCNERNRYTPYITCLSSKKDYLPMWSLYGNKEQGACMCFNNNLEYDIRKPNNTILLTGNVSYTRHYNSIAVQHAVSLFGKSHKLQEDSIDDIVSNLYLGISPFIKKHDYSYEHEYRLCLFNFQNKDDITTYYGG